MTIAIIILAVTCINLAIVQIMQAKRIGELMADNDLHKNAMLTSAKRLDAQNAAIRELTSWNSDQGDSLHNIIDSLASVCQEAENLAKNLIKTDKRVTEIERYYVTYVARKKVEDDGDQIQEKPVSDE